MLLFRIENRITNTTLKLNNISKIKKSPVAPLMQQKISCETEIGVVKQN